MATFIECASLSDGEMQQTAREIGFSETSFIVSDQQWNGGCDVRIFTPGEEIDFAGHPTLGTAFVIQKEIIRRLVDKVVLNIRSCPACGGKWEWRILWGK